MSDFFYKHKTNIYISKAPNATADNTNTVQLNVIDFSFNQPSNIELISRNTLSPTQDRIVDPYASILAPVSFSFTTYVNPLVDTNVTSPEEYLWVSLMGSDTVTSNSTSSTFDFADGNVQELQNLTLWFDQPLNSEGNYRIDNAVIDTATIVFDIKGITQIQWLGRALSMTEDNTPPTSTDRTGMTTYLKNKWSTIALEVNAINYTLALIGGRIEINNNNTFYGRTQLGQTTIPIGHYTGNRVISGNLDFYMAAGSGSSKAVELFDTILSNITSTTYETTYTADITINMGGATAPNLQLNIPQAILGMGRLGFSGVTSVSIPFTAKEESASYSTVVYQMP